jgi:hypothetical protein
MVMTRSATANLNNPQPQQPPRPKMTKKTTKKAVVAQPNMHTSVREIKNKQGEVIEKITTIQAHQPNKKISINEVNKLYKHLMRTQPEKEFMIKVMTYDGMKTLKSYDYKEGDLKYNIEDYYSSMPKDAMDKFMHFFYVQIIS